MKPSYKDFLEFKNEFSYCDKLRKLFEVPKKSVLLRVCINIVSLVIALSQIVQLCSCSLGLYPITKYRPELAVIQSKRGDIGRRNL